MIYDIEDKIVSAAVLFEVVETNETILVCGPRHYDDLMHITLAELRKHVNIKEVAQGFVTVSGTYLNRREAWVIAAYHKQIANELPCNTHGRREYKAEELNSPETLGALVEAAPKLYSENLY